ncbi:hypothetical protein KM043_015695 [Ampulex compressa]|nr:hypothetical protein KM043_015695 [Ampulex compressa]
MQDSRKARTNHAERIIHQPDLKSIEQFPLLKTARTQEIGSGWMTRDKESMVNNEEYSMKDKQEDTETSKYPQNANNDFLDFIKLIEEVKKLNAKFNTSNMLALVKKLNHKIELCNGQVEEFQILLNSVNH